MFFFLGYESDDSVKEVIRKPCRKRKKTDLPRWKIDHITASQTTTNKGKKNATMAIIKALSKCYQSVIKGIIKGIIKAFPELVTLTKFELYEKIFGDIIDLIVTESNKYASRVKNNPSFVLTRETFWNFLVYFCCQVIT